MSWRSTASHQAQVRWIVGLVLLSAWEVSAAENRGIEWRGDLGRAQQEAQAKDRPLWIQFTGPWCSYCHLMDRESFTHQGVISHSQGSLVPVRLQSDVHEDLAGRLGITGLPAAVIVSPNGQVLASHQGFLDGNSFHSFLETALARHVASRPVMKEPIPEPSPMPAPAPESSVGVGLAGFCPVSLVRGQRLVEGDDQWVTDYVGRRYFFADEQGRDEFRRRPLRYAPANGGRCPVSLVDQGESREGDPHYGILFGGHLYLCATEEQRVLFQKTPLRYARVSLLEKDYCPHCWGRDVLQTAGLLHLVAHNGRDMRARSGESRLGGTVQTVSTIRR